MIVGDTLIIVIWVVAGLSTFAHIRKFSADPKDKAPVWSFPIFMVVGPIILAGICTWLILDKSLEQGKANAAIGDKETQK